MELSIVDINLPIEILVEIAAKHGVAFAKLWACCKWLNWHLGRKIKWSQLCRARFEWDGHLLQCGDYCTMWIAQRDNKYNHLATDGRVHGNIDIRLFRRYHDYAKLMLMVSIRAVIFRQVVYSIVVVKRRNAAGMMVAELNEIKPLNCNDHDKAIDLFNQYAIEMYNDKILYAAFYEY